MIDLEEYPVVTENSESYLNQRQLLDYRSEREDCLWWLLTYGKEPDKAEGYAEGTVKPRSYQMDRFYRFVWKLESGYTVNLTHDHADEWMDHLALLDTILGVERSVRQLAEALPMPMIEDIVRGVTAVKDCDRFDPVLIQFLHLTVCLPIQPPVVVFCEYLARVWPALLVVCGSINRVPFPLLVRIAVPSPNLITQTNKADCDSMDEPFVGVPVKIREILMPIDECPAFLSKIVPGLLAEHCC